MYAHWIRFGLDDVTPPRVTGDPGDDWNVCSPKLTSGDENITNQTLKDQKVVQLRDAHIRLMPILTTLPGPPDEPQPPRHPKPKGRVPKGTTWNYVTARWTPLRAPGQGNIGLYDQIVGVRDMLAVSHQRDYQLAPGPRSRTFCAGASHYKWAWAPTVWEEHDPRLRQTGQVEAQLVCPLRAEGANVGMDLLEMKLQPPRSSCQDSGGGPP